MSSSVVIPIDPIKYLSFGLLSCFERSFVDELFFEEIANRLKLEFSDSEVMRVSHETIHKALYVQGRGELRRELARCLRLNITAFFAESLRSPIEPKLR